MMTTAKLLRPSWLVFLGFSGLTGYALVMFAIFTSRSFSPGVIGDMFGLPNAVLNLIIAVAVIMTVREEIQERRSMHLIEHKKWSVEKIDYELSSHTSSYKVVFRDLAPFSPNGEVSGIAAIAFITELEKHREELVSNRLLSPDSPRLPELLDERLRVLSQMDAALAVLRRIIDLHNRKIALLNEITASLESSTRSGGL